MDAIVLAGGVPIAEDPLYLHTQGGYKALLDIGGKPMLQWVLDALGASTSISRVVIVGLPSTTSVSCSHLTTFADDCGDMLLNIQAGARELLKYTPPSPSSRPHALLVASDIPAITPQSIDWMVSRVEESDHDLYYNVIERSVMEQQFPGCKRSYYHLKGMQVTGGDLNAVCTSWVIGDNPLYQRIIAARKNAFKQAALVGFDVLFLLLFRSLSLEKAEKWALRKLKCNAKALVNPFPQTGMDVDKPVQLEIMRAQLAARRPS